MIFRILKSTQKLFSGKIAGLFVLLFMFSQIVSAQSVNVGKAGSQGKVLKKYIEPAELKRIVENPVDSIWIIDVRSEKAYSNGHIPTARSLPAGTVNDRLNEIPKNKYLIKHLNMYTDEKH